MNKLREYIKSILIHEGDIDPDHQDIVDRVKTIVTTKVKPSKSTLKKVKENGMTFGIWNLEYNEDSALKLMKLMQSSDSVKFLRSYEKGGTVYSVYGSVMVKIKKQIVHKKSTGLWLCTIKPFFDGPVANQRLTRSEKYKNGKNKK